MHSPARQNTALSVPLSQDDSHTARTIESHLYTVTILKYFLSLTAFRLKNEKLKKFTVGRNIHKGTRSLSS